MGVVFQKSALTTILHFARVTVAPLQHVLKLFDHELPIVCALRIGTTLCYPHECFYGKKVEAIGRHGLTCSQEVRRFPQLTVEANYLMKRALEQISFPSILEPPNLIGVEGFIPHGVTVFPDKQG